MSTVVRSLTEQGIAAFRQFLADTRSGATVSVSMLGGDEFSRVVAPITKIDASLLFRDKMAFGRYLVETLQPIRAGGGADDDVGLWSWLACAFFDTVCPLRQGERRVGQDHRYVLSHDYQHHYRHLVRTPCIVYDLHRDKARIVLSGPPDKHGEASEQILSRQHLLTNNEFFRALDALYIEEKDGTWKLRQGAGGKGAGSLRRLGKVIRQFDLTFDLYAMSAERILEMLPSEFGRYRSQKP